MFVFAVYVKVTEIYLYKRCTIWQMFGRSRQQHRDRKWTDNTAPVANHHCQWGGSLLIPKARQCLIVFCKGSLFSHGTHGTHQSTKLHAGWLGRSVPTEWSGNRPWRRRQRRGGDVEMWRRLIYAHKGMKVALDSDIPESVSVCIWPFLFCSSKWSLLVFL